MKKIIYFFVVAIVSSFGILLFSCGIDDKDGENALKFNKTEVSVVETFETVVLLENQGDAQVVWTVKDSDIASVNDGIIKGLKAGETVVSATVGTKSVSCDVIVTPINENLFSFVPEKSNYALGIGAEKVLSGKLYYNDILINSDSVTYESNDSAIATISGDKVTAVKAGEVSIVVSAVYYGHTIKATINFVISSDYNIDISNGKINLYSLAEYDGKVYKNSETLNAVVQHQGQQVSADTIQWSVKDSAVCEINGNTVTAKRTGKTEITAKYIIDANNFVEDSVIIEIDPIEAESDIAAIDIDAESGYYLIDTDLLFGGNEVIIEKAELQDDQLIIEIPYESESGRLILDSQFAMFSGENAIRLYTDKISLKFNVYIWTKVIKTPADLQVLSLATYGHYKLGNDISLASADPLSGGDYVFTGVFDGCGYTISYLQVEEAGLFTTVGNGAIIKNLKLTNAQISSDAEKVGVLIKTVKKDSSITLSNIEAEIINKGECSGGFIGVTESNTEVNLNDINAYVYSDGTEERGAVLGASAGSLKTSGEITI